MSHCGVMLTHRNPQGAKANAFHAHHDGVLSSADDDSRRRPSHGRQERAGTGTTLQQMPAALARIDAVRARKAVPVRVINLAGEPLKRALVERIFATTEVSTVCNLYGPSEDTTYSTFAKLSADAEEEDVSIGAPIANTQAYVLGINNHHQLQALD